MRSNIGLINFKQGGFLIDLKIKNKSFSKIDKVFFPEDWRIILIKDTKQGLHGKNEINAFKKIRSFPKINHIKLTDLVLFKIYPSLIENNFNEFSKAVSKLQNIMGKYFNMFQNGMIASYHEDETSACSTPCKIKGG